MAYVKTVWQTGDTVTAEKLNHIEEDISNASSGGNLIIHQSEGGPLDKTWKEIHDAMAAGITPVLIIVLPSGIELWSATTIDEEEGYVVIFRKGSSENLYEAETENGYPTSHY